MNVSSDLDFFAVRAGESHVEHDVLSLGYSAIKTEVNMLTAIGQCH